MRVRAAEHRGKRFLVALSDRAASLIAALLMLAVALVLARGLGAWLGLGPLSSHMGQHILLMNAAASFAALMLVRVIPPPRSFADSIGPLAGATAAQIVLLWGWHTPPVLAMAWQQPSLLLAMHASLFGIAVLFWFSVFCVPGNGRWRPILALLVTGKLFCLLGALLVFAPRSLYPLAQSAHSAAGWSGLADQQLAGLLMIVACPLTYITAGVVIAARWVLQIDSEVSARRSIAGAEA